LLLSKGKLKAEATIAFTPASGSSGTQAKSVVLKKKTKKKGRAGRG
jgi:hypothetical protein